MQEFPKAIYHPTTKELFIARTIDEEGDKLEEWGMTPAPQIPLGEKPADEPVQEEPVVDSDVAAKVEESAPAAEGASA